MKIIKSLFYSALILNVLLLEKKVIAVNINCANKNFIIDFKQNEGLIKSKNTKEYNKFESAHEFLNKIVLYYELFDSNNFLVRKYREYVFRSIFATSKISRIKELVESKPLKFSKNKEIIELNKSLIDEINYFKINYEKIETANLLNSANKDLADLNQKIEINGISSSEYKELINKKEVLSKKIEDLNKQLSRPLNIEGQLVVNDFSYNINGETKSYRDLPNITDKNILFSILDKIYADLKIVIFKNISSLTEYEQNERLNFMNQTKTFSYAEFKNNNSEVSLYYSISGQNFYFKKPTAELKNNLLNKVNSSDYIFTREKIKDKIEIIDTLLKNDIRLVSQIDKHLLPAINTDKKVISLTNESVKNSNEFNIYKDLPINYGKSTDEILTDFIDLKNNQELGLQTMLAFKNGNDVLDSKARKYDSEFKLLNQFLYDTENNANLQGELVVYTSKPACNSCITGYESFKENRPNVKLKVIALATELEAEMKSNYLQMHAKKTD